MANDDPTLIEANKVRRVARQRELQVRMIALLRAGRAPRAACDELGRTYSWFMGQKRKDPIFREKCADAVRAYLDDVKRDRKRARAREGRFELDSKVSGDFVAWRERYLGFKTFPHLRFMLDAMDRAGPGSITMILCPPEWMKTTLLEDLVTYWICEDPNDRIAVISEGQDHARKFVGRVQRRLEEDGPSRDLVTHFGPFKDPTGRKPWNADFMTVLNATADERDYTLETAGVKSTIRGARYRKVILDDIQSERSLAETKKFVEIVRNDIVTRPGKDGRIFIIGSRVNSSDVYEAFLEDENFVDQVVVIPALGTTECCLGEGIGHSNFPPQFDDDGTPVIDERGVQIGWSDEELAKRRQKVGEDIWDRVYMQRPRSLVGASINQEEILRACDRARAVGQRVGVDFIGGLDPAIANHAAFMVCGFDSSHLYVVDAVDLYQPRRFEVLYAQIEALSVRYEPSYWVVESNHIQEGLALSDQMIEMQGRLGFRVLPQHTGAQKIDEMLGVPAMLTAIIRGDITFPGVGLVESPAFAMLFSQLENWRPDIATRFLQQDLVMALYHCWRAWKNLRQRIAADMSAWRRGPAPSISEYPYARTNVQLPGSEQPSKRKSYEEVWAGLARAQ